MRNILQLVNEKEMLESRIKKIAHGSVEIREKNEHKYIYVHYREEGLLITKYVGEYSIELYNLILENNKIVKEYKKQLKIIKKELNKLEYQLDEISDAVKLNIDFARKNMVASIYKQAQLEGVATTYSDTETIINGGKVKEMTSVDIAKVINLKHAWEFILSEGVIAYPTNYNILCQINKIVEEGFSYTAGRIRSIPVLIGGSDYVPPIPYEPQIIEDLKNIIDREDSFDVAIELLLYVMKKQVFIDGNKRTAVILANHYLISRGLGLIVIPAELVDKFKKLLIKYYETSDEEIKNFLITKCATRI